MNNLKTFSDFINESIRDKMTGLDVKSIYDKHIEPIVDDLALTIYKKIKEGDWKIYEVLSEPGEKYKYGEYRPHEPWGYFAELYDDNIDSGDENYNDVTDIYDSITNMLTNEMEKRNLLKLEW